MEEVPPYTRVPRSGLGKTGWAEYGYCASIPACSRGCAWSAPLHGLPVGWALTGAKADEPRPARYLGLGPHAGRGPSRRPADHDRGRYHGKVFEADLADAGIQLLRPARKGEPVPSGLRFFKPLRQIVESINDTLKGQLNLEAHGGRPPPGLRPRRPTDPLHRRDPAHDRIGLPVRRSLIAYDH